MISIFPVLLLCEIESAPTSYSLALASALTGIHQERIRYYCRLGLLSEPLTRIDADLRFDDDDLFMLRRFEHYRRSHRLRRKTLRLVFSLVNEVERLRAELRVLRD